MGVICQGYKCNDENESYMPVSVASGESTRKRLGFKAPGRLHRKIFQPPSTSQHSTRGSINVYRRMDSWCIFYIVTIIGNLSLDMSLSRFSFLVCDLSFTMKGGRGGLWMSCLPGEGGISIIELLIKNTCINSGTLNADR